MTNISTIKSMMEMMNIDELRELNLEINKIILDKEDLDSFENLSEEELEDLIDEEYKEVVQRVNYINTKEYYWMLTLRTIGVQISYEKAKEIIDKCIDMHIDFGYKHPYDYLEEDIINIYNQYYK
jgi:hypothetical protein